MINKKRIKTIVKKNPGTLSQTLSSPEGRRASYLLPISNRIKGNWCKGSSASAFDELAKARPWHQMQISAFSFTEIDPNKVCKNNSNYNALYNGKQCTILPEWVHCFSGKHALANWNIHHNAYLMTCAYQFMYYIVSGIWKWKYDHYDR